MENLSGNMGNTTTRKQSLKEEPKPEENARKYSSAMKSKERDALNSTFSREAILKKLSVVSTPKSGLAKTNYARHMKGKDDLKN